MKVIIKVIESYIPKTDDVGIRINALLLQHKTEDQYTPTKEFSIGFKKDCAYDNREVVKTLRNFADMIENAAT